MIKYKYIDGDNIGLSIELSFLNNDETTLKEINQNVSQTVLKITNFLILKGQEIIFAGADGIICKGEEFDSSELIDFIRLLKSNLTFSFGSGDSLKDSYIALRYAKSLGKNIGVVFENNSFKITEGMLTRSQ